VGSTPIRRTNFMEAVAKPEKPLKQKAYGSIPHLPGSRRGAGDHGLEDAQARILTEKARKWDLITVQEKLDGSCVSVAKIGGQIIPLIRAGYKAVDSDWKQYHFFHEWAMANKARFASLMCDGQRCVGEWLMEAHGTRYALPHEPFVVFDIMAGHARVDARAVASQCRRFGFTTPRVLHEGGPLTIEAMLTLLEPSGHGALDPVEGAVWRVENQGCVDFLGKYVRPEKTDGCYLESVTGNPPIYNWQPNP
jgi:hypothetical protein